MTAPFDTDGLRQWATLVVNEYVYVDAVGYAHLPRLVWNQMVADLQAAADHIDMLEDRDPEETS